MATTIVKTNPFLQQVQQKSLLANIDATNMDKEETIYVCFEATKNADRLKSALDAMNMYEEKATEFIRLEAQTWVDAARLIKHPLKGSRHRGTSFSWNFGKTKLTALNHLIELKDNERVLIPDMCAARGCRIVHFMTKLHEQAVVENDIEYLNNQQRDIVSRFKQNGCVKVNFDHYANSSRTKSAAASFAMSTRSKLLKAGGVCVDENTYLLPSKCDAFEFSEAVAKRLKSIHDDATALCELIQARSDGSHKKMLENEPLYRACVSLSQIEIPARWNIEKYFSSGDVHYEEARWLTAKEVAIICDQSEATIKKRCREGAYKNGCRKTPGGTWLINTAAWGKQAI